MADDLQVPLLGFVQFDSYFYITPQQLASLFEVPNIHDGASLQKLRNLGSVQGISQKLRSDLVKGLDIINNKEEADKSKQIFGENIIKQPSKNSIFHYIWLKLQDLVLKLLLISSIIQLVLCKIAIPEMIVGSYFILVGILFVIGIGAYNDKVKDGLFKILEQKGQEKQATVFRQGRAHIIDSQDILVGDIIEIKTGEKLSVDGILFMASSKLIIENSISKEVEQQKTPNNIQNQKHHDPFILSGSKIVQGNGIMLVTCVGEYTYQYRHEVPTSDDQSTALKVRLEEIAERISLPSLFMSILILIVLITIYSNNNLGLDEFSWTKYIGNLFEYLTFAFALLAIVIPESLPSFYLIYLAYTSQRLLKHNVLVQRLDACEKMAEVTNICTDKTGALTQNKMKVVKL